MSDKAAFRDSSKDNPEDGANAPDGALSSTPLVRTDSTPPLDGGTPAAYGPAPKPVTPPVIFDPIYKPSVIASAASTSSGLPSFNLSAPSSASTPVNTVSFQSGNHGEQPLPKSTTEPVTEPSLNGETDKGETPTISVESQCDSPSLDDLTGMDISEASREELMVYHSELMGWIRELESALQDCQSDFKAHLHQYGQQEHLLEQRTQELLALKERHRSLNQEVDVQQKTHQRQTILVETLQEQLGSSQERVAQMERDFSQVQRRCSDQAQQLLQAEGLCRDLKSRLGRQQRHTMQFKAALEKSLAVSVNDSDYDLGDVDMDSMDSSGELFPRPKPVKPWSNQLDEAALSQALTGLDQAGDVEQSRDSENPGVTKGLHLQLAFENPEDAELGSAQVKAASQAIAAGEPVEQVFDPEQAEDLEAALKQESESIFQGELLGNTSASVTKGCDGSSQMPLVNNRTVAFVPPITPILPEDASEQSEVLSEAEACKDRVVAVQAGGDDAEATTATKQKKRTTLAGISLPSFPKF